MVKNIRCTVWITELLTQPIWIWVTGQATLSDVYVPLVPHTQSPLSRIHATSPLI